MDSDNPPNSHNYLIRLFYPSGAIDPTFNINPQGEVHAIEIQNNGYIIVGGQFAGVDSPEGTNAVHSYFRITDKGQFDHSFVNDDNTPRIPNLLPVSPEPLPIIYSIAIEEN